MRQRRPPFLYPWPVCPPRHAPPRPASHPLPPRTLRSTGERPRGWFGRCGFRVAGAAVCGRRTSCPISEDATTAPTGPQQQHAPRQTPPAAAMGTPWSSGRPHGGFVGARRLSRSAVDWGRLGRLDRPPSQPRSSSLFDFSPGRRRRRRIQPLPHPLTPPPTHGPLIPPTGKHRTPRPWLTPRPCRSRSARPPRRSSASWGSPPPSSSPVSGYSPCRARPGGWSKGRGCLCGSGGVGGRGWVGWGQGPAAVVSRHHHHHHHHHRLMDGLIPPTHTQACC